MTFLAIASPLCYKVSGGHDTEAAGAIQRDNRGGGGGRGGVACRHPKGQCTSPPLRDSHDSRVLERLEEAAMLHVRMKGSWENANIRAHKLSRTGR